MIHLRNYSWVFLAISLLVVSCQNRESQQATTENSPVSALKNPSQTNSALPRLFSNGDALFFSWVTSTDSLDHLNYSKFDGEKWQEPETIILGNDWFTNWADFPAIAENNGNLLTSFLQKSDSGTYTYDVKLNLLKRSDSSWKKNFKLHSDTTKSEHGFVSMRSYAGNSFLVTWLDGRETVGKGHGGGAMTLRAALVFEDGTIDYDTLLDEKVCDCCQTSSAIGPDDEILVAYRDRSDAEIRDISVVKWDKQIGWGKPLTLGNDDWNIEGCPVNGPSIDSYNSSVAVAWFSGAEDEGKVNVVFSKEVGSNYGEAIRIDSGNATGRVDVVLLNESEAAVFWMEPEAEDELIRVMKVSSEGRKSTPITISKTTAERASGFPQMEKLGNTLFFA
ncbi:MAG: hypothetical protein HKN48_05595, partial [Flavobacteriaceae bacterium]|nr:hypothetical protein [Flavobacteriaceae bacterium]